MLCSRLAVQRRHLMSILQNISKNCDFMRIRKRFQFIENVLQWSWEAARLTVSYSINLRIERVTSVWCQKYIKLTERVRHQSHEWPKKILLLLGVTIDMTHITVLGFSPYYHFRVPATHPTDPSATQLSLAPPPPPTWPHPFLFAFSLHTQFSLFLSV